MSEELYRKYRPTSFKEVIGQPSAVKAISSFGKTGKIPHFLLFTGPSGCGKTTLARILRRKMKCADIDFHEVNAAQERGIDMVRQINDQIWLSPIGGPCKIWLCDEAHQLTAEAQGGFLKLLEDTPDHVYFFFATTDPQKLKRTIRTRATEIKVTPLSDEDMEALLDRVAEQAGAAVDSTVRDKIIRSAGGSPRMGLVLLNKVIGESDPDKAVAVLEDSQKESEGIELARAIFNGASWPQVAKILQGIEGLDDQAEGLRWLILSYAKSVALKSSGDKVDRACRVIEVFRDNFYDSKAAGLVACCREVI